MKMYVLNSTNTYFKCNSHDSAWSVLFIGISKQTLGFLEFLPEF